MYDAFKKVTEITGKAITNGIKYNGTIEQLQTSFEVMTGSADKAREIIEKLRKVGAETPYELEGLASTVQLLMQYGMTADQAYESTLQLGDISQGSATKMQGIALALGQMSSYGKVTLQDIKQMIGNGFNPLQEISKTTDESMTSLYDRISKGTLTVEEVTKAFKTASSEGGSYFQSMEKQSKTLNGQLSTLSDNFNELTGSAMKEISNLLVDTILPKTNELLSNITENMPTIIEQFSNLLKKVIDIIPYLEAVGIIVVGWKIGTIIQGVIQGFQKAQIALSLYSLQTNGASIAQGLFNGTLTIGETLVGLFTGKVTLAQLATAGLAKAQTALNAVMSENPVALVIIAIAALIAIFVILWNKCEWFRNFWIELWNNIKEIFEPIVNSIINFFTNTIPNAIQSFINFFSNFPYNVGYLIGQAIAWFVTLPQRIKQHFDESKQKMQEWISNMLIMVRNKIPEIINSIRNFFAELPNNMLNIGKNIVEGLWNGIVNAKNWLLGKIGQFTKGIMDGFKNKTTGFDINSPSHKTRDEVGKFLPKGIAVGIEANTDEALRAIDNMNNDIMSEMNRAVAFETGSINASASVKSNNSLLNVIQATFNIDGSVDIDGQKAGRILTPIMTKTLRTGGAY